MLPHAARLAIVSVLLSIGFGSRAAQAASFTGLGDLPGGIFGSSATDVSDDLYGSGPVVVGGSNDSENSGQGFRWSRGEGMVGLGTLPGGSFSGAEGVSRDGSVIVGTSAIGHGVQAFRWTATGGMVGLEAHSLPSDAYLPSEAYGISADGETVVGYVDPLASRWTAASGIEGLGDLPGGYSISFAYDVTADGSVIVGVSSATLGDEAFYSTASGGMVGLGDLPGGDFFSTALGVSSADGPVVVGNSHSANGPEAFRWTASGGMSGLGDLEGGRFESSAWSVSGDGSVVVGLSHGFLGREAYIWDQGHGMRLLRDVLENDFGLDLGGWVLEHATAISDDGLSIVGYGQNPNGDTEAWLVTGIPEPSTALLLALGLLGVGAGRYHRARTYRGGCRDVEERDRDRHRGGGVCQLRSGSSSTGR